MIGEQSLAEMTEGRAAETAHVWTEGEIAATQDDAAREKTSLLELAVELQHSFFSRRLSTPNEDSATKGKAAKHRFGLPQGFVSRLGRYGRTTLFRTTSIACQTVWSLFHSHRLERSVPKVTSTRSSRKSNSRRSAGDRFT